MPRMTFVLVRFPLLRIAGRMVRGIVELNHVLIVRILGFCFTIMAILLFTPRVFLIRLCLLSAGTPSSKLDRTIGLKFRFGL